MTQRAATRTNPFRYPHSAAACSPKISVRIPSPPRSPVVTVVTKLNRTTYRLSTEQWFPYPLDDVFDFFADASNLEKITPPWLNFTILTPDVIMREGATIDYRLKLKGVPIIWRTEIPVWDPPNRFVDNQLQGPYKKWYHRHLFEAQDGGTLVKDIIDYIVPGGAVINKIFVEPDVRKIFRHRQQRLAYIFPTPDTSVQTT